MASKKVFLAVSDEQMATLLERSVLRPGGYHVQVASTPADADAIIQGYQPHVAVVSERLDGSDSLELVEKWQRRFPALPIILIAENDLTASRLLSLMRAGVREILELPLKRDEIVKAVQNAIELSDRYFQWANLLNKEHSDFLLKQLDLLDELGKVGRSITASLDLDYILTTVVDTAVEITQAEEGSLLLVDDETGELYIRASRNFQDEFVRTFRLPIKDTLAGQVVRTGEPAEIKAETPQKIKTSYLVKTLVYVPLKIHGKVIGVLGVDNRETITQFTEEHIRLLNALADYAAIAIENARLFQESEAERKKLESILTEVEDGVIVLDVYHRLLLINRTAREAFNLTEEQVIGLPARDVFVGTPLSDLIENHLNSKRYRDEVTLEDGRTFNALLSSIEGVGVVIAMQDITHLKELDRIKSDFVNAVSHDLRSPLTAILGYVELIERVGEVNEQQREFIRRVQISVRNITELINDLLDLGKIESGFDTRKEVVALDAILKLTIEEMAKQAEEKALQLELSVEDNLPKVFGDPTRLRQLINNLVSNAVKYTPAGGKVSVSARAENEQLILQVSDTGPGIPPSDQPYIFDKFYRASNVPTDTPGTGLGLAIVKSIVENHQGRIWVESTVGKGTTFTVVLPLLEESGD